jgi:hypothetical protein
MEAESRDNSELWKQKAEIVNQKSKIVNRTQYMTQFLVHLFCFNTKALRLSLRYTKFLIFDA